MVSHVRSVEGYATLEDAAIQAAAKACNDDQHPRISAILFAERYDPPTPFKDMDIILSALRMFEINQIRVIEPQRFVISGHLGSTHRLNGRVGSVFGQSFGRVIVVSNNNDSEEGETECLRVYAIG